MGLYSSKKHFGIAAFAVAGYHSLQGFWVSLPIPVPASSMGMNSGCFATTRERGEESIHAPLLAESLMFQSCFLRDIALLPGLSSSPRPLPFLHRSGC